MSDDIGEVRNPSPFAPLRRATRGEARERLADDERGHRGEGRYSEEESGGDEAPAGPTREEIARQVEAANVRLAAAGRGVRLAVGDSPAGVYVEVIMLDSAGANLAAARIDPREIAGWMKRIETSEGLLLDDTL